MSHSFSAIDFQAIEWAAYNPSDKPEVTRVPTMLAKEETGFYAWVTEHWMQGIGEVVDLGCFIGGSTARLAHGHAAADHPGKIHAYDKFTADDNVKQRILYRQGIEAFEGNDIFPLTQDLLSPWKNRITLHQGSIEDIGWNGDPIEVLCVDAFKKAALADVMTRQFFPSLIPGKSILIHQDFLHPTNPWICAQMIGLGDAVVPVAHVEKDTVVYLVQKEITPELLDQASIANLSDETIFTAIEKTRETLRAFNLDARLDETEARLRANPGVRVAWKMQNK